MNSSLNKIPGVNSRPVGRLAAFRETLLRSIISIGGCRSVLSLNSRGIIRWVSISAVASVVLFVVLLLPRTRPLPKGYTYAYFPRGGHRYILAPGGIKKVGQEVLDYHVIGTVVSGKVRLQLEHDDIRLFSLDLKTHQVTLGDRVQSDAH